MDTLREDMLNKMKWLHLLLGRRSAYDLGLLTTWSRIDHVGRDQMSCNSDRAKWDGTQRVVSSVSASCSLTLGRQGKHVILMPI